MGRQRVKANPETVFGLTRDGELIGVGLSREEAEGVKEGLTSSHPECTYAIVSNPKPKGKKVNP